MKSFVMLILIFLSTMSFSQSNRQRLEDIDDRLEMMQAEQEYKDLQRRFEQRNRESKEVLPPKSDELKSLRNQENEPYKNRKSEELRVRDAKFLNLSMSEYLRRDEISHYECQRFNSIKDTNNWHSCHFSKLLNISFTETEMRKEKAAKKCPKGETVENKNCWRSILIFGK